MTTLNSTPDSSNQATNPDAAYAWYLLNRDEINEITYSDDLLRTLQQLEAEAKVCGPPP